MHLTPELAAAQKARVRAGDADAVHFAWYGPNTPEKAFGYRLIGDGFVIEMGSVDEAAQHLHTIYHDLGNVLGRVPPEQSSLHRSIAAARCPCGFAGRATGAIG